MSEKEENEEAADDIAAEEQRSLSAGPALFMGAFSLLFAVLCANEFVTTLDTARLSGHALILLLVAAGCLAVAAFFLYFGIRAASDSDYPGSPEYADDLCRAKAIMAPIALTVLAGGFTIVAFLAWAPEHARRFHGGMTGSIWEHRLVWGIVALLLDALWLYALVHYVRSRRNSAHNGGHFTGRGGRGR